MWQSVLVQRKYVHYCKKIMKNECFFDGSDDEYEDMTFEPRKQQTTSLPLCMTGIIITSLYNIGCIKQ